VSTNKINKISTEEWITQAEAARIRGVSRQAINKLIKKGRIKTIKVSSIILVDRKDIENFESLNSGRPRKQKNG
jgi:excisionase family DNA binding protein